MAASVDDPVGRSFVCVLAVAHVSFICSLGTEAEILAQVASSTFLLGAGLLAAASLSVLPRIVLLSAAGLGGSLLALSTAGETSPTADAVRRILLAGYAILGWWIVTPRSFPTSVRLVGGLAVAACAFWAVAPSASVSDAHNPLLTEPAGNPNADLHIWSQSLGTLTPTGRVVGRSNARIRQIIDSQGSAVDSFNALGLFDPRDFILVGDAATSTKPGDATNDSIQVSLPRSSSLEAVYLESSSIPFQSGLSYTLQLRGRCQQKSRDVTAVLLDPESPSAFQGLYQNFKLQPTEDGLNHEVTFVAGATRSMRLRILFGGEPGSWDFAGVRLLPVAPNLADTSADDAGKTSIQSSPTHLTWDRPTPTKGHRLGLSFLARSNEHSRLRVELGSQRGPWWSLDDHWQECYFELDAQRAEDRITLSIEGPPCEWEFRDVVGVDLGQTARYAAGQRTVVYDLDADGFRRHASTPQAADASTCLCLGDSVLFGVGLPADVTIPARLERILAHDRPPIRIINGSLPGWGVVDYSAALQRVIDHLRPHAVLVCLTPDDANSYIDELRLQEGGSGLPHVSADGSLARFLRSLFAMEALCRRNNAQMLVAFLQPKDDPQAATIASRVREHLAATPILYVDLPVSTVADDQELIARALADHLNRSKPVEATAPRPERTAEGHSP